MSEAPAKRDEARLSAKKPRPIRKGSSCDGRGFFWLCPVRYPWRPATKPPVDRTNATRPVCAKRWKAGNTQTERRAKMQPGGGNMPDRHGLPLRPGDPALIQDEVTGTVLRELPDNCYLVQLDPDAPRGMTGATPAQIATPDQLEPLVAG